MVELELAILLSSSQLEKACTLEANFLGGCFSSVVVCYKLHVAIIF